MTNAIPVAIALTLAAQRAAQPAAPPRLPQEWRMLAREIFAEVVRIDTTHEKGSAGAVEAIARRLRAAGYTAAELVTTGPSLNEQNLVVWLRGTGKALPVLYVLHLDVVPARREDWPIEPFTLREQDGWFYGRGTSDMKDDVAAMVTTLVRLRKEGYRPDRDVVVAFTDDAEVGPKRTNGVSWLLANRRELVRAELAINSDAGGGEIRKGRRSLLGVQTSEKVYASFRLLATDRGGHSSIPHAGNPIYRLAAALSRVGAFQFPVRLDQATRSYFAAVAKQERGALADDLALLGRTPPPPAAPADQGVKPRPAADPVEAAAARVSAASDLFAALMRTTCVATELVGGHAEGALPQRAGATVNCSLVPDESPRDVLTTLRRVIFDADVEVTPIAPAASSPPSSLDPSVMQPLEAVASAMFPRVPIAPILSTWATDSLALRAAGIPTYGVSGMFNDVDDVRAHGREERIGVEDFYDGVEFSYRFLKALAGGASGRTGR